MFSRQNKSTFRRVRRTGLGIGILLALLLATSLAMAGPELLAAYTFNCNANGRCLEAINSGSGVGLYGSTASGGNGAVRGVTPPSNMTGIGVYGKSAEYYGVFGEGGSSVGDAGGAFSGYYGAIGHGDNGPGLWGSTATGESGAVIGFTGAGNLNGIGVRGVAYSGIGVSGQGGPAAGDYGGYFTGDIGIYAESVDRYGAYIFSNEDDGLFAATNGTQTTDYGALISSGGRGMYANGGSGQWDGYFKDCARIGATTYGNCGTGAPLSAGMSIIAVNNGSDVLAPGDVVVFQGMGMVDGVPDVVMLVAKASGAAGEVAIGVMKDAYTLMPGDEEATAAKGETSGDSAGGNAEAGATARTFADMTGREAPPEGFLPNEPASLPDLGNVDSGMVVGGNAAPGGLLFVQIQGIALVNVDAADGAIEAGQSLVAGWSGRAAAAPADLLEGATGMKILGYALESLPEGSGSIYVLLGLR